MKVDEELTQLQVGRPLFYYFGTTTVCLLRREGVVASRGIAICSPKDQFRRKVGRAKALGRAIQAIKKGEDTGEIIPERFGIIYSINLSGARIEFGKWKACLFPVLTEMEQRIVENGNRNRSQNKAQSI